jgi:hypothetical protein
MNEFQREDYFFSSIDPENGKKEAAVKHPWVWASAIGILLSGIGAVTAAEVEDSCVRAVRALSTDGADYQPGTDVYGRSVVPADVQPTLRVDPPQVIEFPIDLDLAKRMGFNAAGAYEGKATMARVRIEGRRITVNGQEVASDAAADLIAACRAASR